MTKISRLLALGFFTFGCEGEIDYNDELGLQGDPVRPRTEIVPLDRSLSSSENQMSDKVDFSTETPMSTEAPINRNDQAGSIMKELTDDAFSVKTDHIKAIAYDPFGSFTVQVAGYKEKKSAKNLLSDLLDDGYPAYLTQRNGNGEARVRIGYFNTFDDASNFGRLLRADLNLEFWVDRRENE